LGVIEAKRDVMRKQSDVRVDVVNDGEVGKGGFSVYPIKRISGITEPANAPYKNSPAARDMLRFPDYFAGQQSVKLRKQYVASGPLQYTDLDAVAADIASTKAASEGIDCEEVFMTAVAPATLEHWVHNDYYSTDEEFIEALSNVMAQEYRMIVDAGFILQLDNPDVLNGWGIYTEMSVAEFRKFQESRTEALNHALRGISQDRIRMHVCWGANRAPHTEDIPLADVIDILFKTNVQGFSIEASNPRHLHDWKVFQNFKMPDGKILIPGVIGHASDFIEHPEAIADRLIQYAKLVGRENVIAGTDCGLSGARVGHPSIAWAKLQAMADGARLATEQLWS
jgi:5-methyltetrahydropteroyltriglutamate--homocysteine methyltransferase